MASKKITELPLITGISGSVGYGVLDYRSVIPVVVGGSTNQITVEDFSIYAVRHSATTQSNTFLGNQTITGNISVSGTSTLTGNTSVGGTLGVTSNATIGGNASVGGNLVVAGRITAEEFHTEITTASVIYASGSTKFGDTIDDKHEFTGSTQISGSFTLNGGVILNGTTFDISQLYAYTQSLKNEVGTIEAYTASVKETISQTLTYTQSLKETISQTLAYTASVKETISQTLAYTGSVKQTISQTLAYTASLKGAVLPNGTNLDVFGNLRVSGSTYFGDNASDNTIITGNVQVTGSVSSTGGNTADFIQLSTTPSGVAGTGKLIWDSTNGGRVNVGGNISATGFTGSFQSTNGSISASAQITELPSIQQATASLAAFTGSIRAELGNVEAYTASLKETITQTLAYTASVKETISQTLAYTASVKSEISDIESYTASLKETITQTLAYTGSVKETISQTLVYTGSVKESISQTLAYTASVKSEISDIEAYTASLKSAVSVNSTNATILGSLTINQNLNVLGSASIQYITSSQLNIFDNIISVNTFTPAVRFGGLAVIDSGSNPQTSGSILFDSQENQWIFVHQNAGIVTSSLLLMGAETYNNVGNETHPTTNRILKSVNDEHLGDSNITDDGTNVLINSNTQITGSLNVSAGITGSLQGTAALATSVYTPSGTANRILYQSAGGASSTTTTDSALTWNSGTGTISATSMAVASAGTFKSALDGTNNISMHDGSFGIMAFRNGDVDKITTYRGVGSIVKISGSLVVDSNSATAIHQITGSVNVDGGVTGSFKGNLNGTATYAGTVSIGNSSSNTNYALIFTTAGSNGYLSQYTDAVGGMLYNPSTNKLIQSGSIDVSGSLSVNGDAQITGSISTRISSADYAASFTNVNDSSQGILVRTTDNDTSLYIARFQSSPTAVSEAYVDRLSLTKGGLLFVSGSQTISGSLLVTSYASVNTTKGIASAFNIGDGLKANNGTPLSIHTDDTNTMQFVVNRVANTSFKLQSVEQGVAYRDIYFNNDGGAVYAGSARIDNNSDIRIKDNIQPIENALSKVLSMTGKKYHMIDEPADKIRLGFVAQELQGVVDELVIESDRKHINEDGTIIENLLGLETMGSAWAALLVESIKEQQTIIEQLKARIETLENK